jgi:hypothetical protein
VGSLSALAQQFVGAPERFSEVIARLSDAAVYGIHSAETMVPSNIVGRFDQGGLKFLDRCRRVASFEVHHAKSAMCAGAIPRNHTGPIFGLRAAVPWRR